MRKVKDDTTVEMKTANKSVTVTGEQFKQAPAAVSRALGQDDSTPLVGAIRRAVEQATAELLSANIEEFMAAVAADEDVSGAFAIKSTVDLSGPDPTVKVVLSWSEPHKDERIAHIEDPNQLTFTLITGQEGKALAAKERAEKAEDRDD